MKSLIPSRGYSCLQQAYSQAKQKSLEIHPSPKGKQGAPAGSQGAAGAATDVI